MKKWIAYILVLSAILTLAACDYAETVDGIALPFQVEDVENVEMYHYKGDPSAAEKKVVTEAKDIETLYHLFTSLPLQRKEPKETSGAEISSFRFNLSDQTNYEIIYVGYGVKNGELISAASHFSYFTSADIGWNWSYLNEEYETVPAEEADLPKLPNG